MKMPKFISQILIRRGFRKLSRKLDDIKDEQWTARRVVDYLFSSEAELIQPWQVPSELQALSDEVEKKKPKTVVEIGTANGGTLFMACRLSTSDALIVSIDLPGGSYGGGYPSWKIPYYESFASRNQRLVLLRGDSHSDEMVTQLKKILNGKKIDYLFIDGDHTLEGVKKDFANYSALCSHDSLIAFHDISERSDEYGVPIFWNEIKQQYVFKEFIHHPNRSMFGVGVLLNRLQAVDN